MESGAEISAKQQPKSATTEQHKEEQCVKAFKGGNKSDAEKLLPITRSRVAVIRTTVSLGWLVAGLASLLHLAAFYGWLDIAIELLTKYNCYANWKDDKGRIPLHYAAYSGHLEVLTYLINKQHCHPMTTDDDGRTPLHWACVNGHLNITQYLISELQCDPSTVNHKGWTPLHFACSWDHVDIVRYLLSTGKVDPLAETKYGSTPVYWASRSKKSYDLLKLFQPFEQCKKDFPVHTFTKVILVGYSGAGKTTVAKLLVLLASSDMDLATSCAADMQRLTAGIVPLHIESKLKEVSNMVVYDFAGQQEYYSSHAAFLEHVMHRSAAIFVCMVDLSQRKKDICETIHYWLSFIENACNTGTAEVMSQVVIVGSHADLVSSSQELQEKSSLVQKIADSRMKQLSYGGFLSMDCRQADTDEAQHFISLLSNSQQAIVAKQPSISFYCHVLYAFLRTKLNKTGCMLQELTSVLAAENDSSLPSDPSILTEFLTTLNNKGLILFVKNKEYLLSSWIVVEKEALLREVNGTLFAPKHFKEHHEIASNTGLVPIISLQKVFPQHSSDMLVGVFKSMEFCHPVDSSVLQYTNLLTTPTHSTAEGLLFFPSLIRLNRPDSVTQDHTLCFGWCLGCMDPHQFFSSRFLHVLLLCVAYTFPLSIYCNPASSPLRELQRRCTVWRNGISWSDDDDITVVVELINNNRWVVVAMSSSKDRPVEHAKLRSALIGLVHQLQQEHCSNLDLCECLISPTFVQQYPFNNLPDTDLFDIQDVARSILCRKPSVLSRNKDCIGLSQHNRCPLSLTTS